MSRRQAFRIILISIVINALISLGISLTVVTLFQKSWEGQQTALSPLILPTATPAGSALKFDQLYIIQPGDSLSGIAARFHVSLDDLMRANDLTDPDLLSAGQRLLIPGGPVPTRPTPTPTPTPTGTLLPFEPPTAVVTGTQAVSPIITPASGVMIRAVLSAGQLEQEALRIDNAGDTAQELEGWSVADQHGHRYRFPALRLEPTANVTLHTRAGEDNSTDLYWGLDIALWENGATAILKDRDGEVVSSFGIE